MREGERYIDRGIYRERWEGGGREGVGERGRERYREREGVGERERVSERDIEMDVREEEGE